MHLEFTWGFILSIFFGLFGFVIFIAFGLPVLYDIFVQFFTAFI